MRLGPPLTAPPQRIVSLAPSLTETVLALGAGERLVGVSRYDDFEAVRDLPRVGGYVDPSLEAILGLRPDLVLAEKSPGNAEVVKKLAALGIPVLVVRARNLEEVRDAIRAVADALDLRPEGTALLRRLDAALEEARSLGAGRPRIRALIVYGHAPLVVAGPGSFGDELLRLCGAENVAHSGGTAYPTWPLERLLADPPDVVVDLAGDHEQRTGPLARLAALKDRVRRLRSKDLLRPGPGLGRGAKVLCRVLRDARTTAEVGGASHQRLAPPEVQP